MLNSKNTQYKIIIWGLIYWASLIITYVWSMQNHLSTGMPVNLEEYKLILATIAVTIMLYLIPNDNSILSLFISVILYVVVFPVGVIYSCQGRENLYFIMVFFCTTFVELMVKHFSLRQVTLCIGKSNPSKFVVIGSILILLLSVLVLYRERGVPSLNSFNFALTYEIRSSYELSSLASRLFSITTKAIIPFFIAISFIKKKYRTVFLLLAIQLLFFLWLANKTTVFSIGVLVIGYVLAKSKKATLLFSKLMSIGVIAISIPEAITGSIDGGVARLIYWAYSLVIRRTIILPAYLKYSYYDYFVLQRKPLAGLFGTFIAPILTRLGVPFAYNDLSFSKVIGKYYYMDANANTGLFGAELAHFGIFGMFVAAFLLVFFLLCVKKSEKTNGRIFTCCLAIYTILGLSDAGAIGMIDFTPMFLITLMLYFFKLDGIYEQEDLLGKRAGILIRKAKFRI